MAGALTYGDQCEETPGGASGGFLYWLEPRGRRKEQTPPGGIEDSICTHVVGAFEVDMSRAKDSSGLAGIPRTDR